MYRILTLLLFPALVFGQVDMKNFALFGTAVQVNDECFRLTEDEYYQSGSFQYRSAIDLRKPFYMEMEVFLGCNDELGADGIVFIFYPGGGQLGGFGEAMGFGGLAPSLGIELDTYYNDHLSDPQQDHVAVMLNGRLWHGSTTADPFTLPNLEDCAYHPFTISWDPAKQLLEATLDGRRIVSAQIDLVGKVFASSPTVFWGASAATARKKNRQEVCFRKLLLGSAPEALPRLDFTHKNDLMNGRTVRIPEFQFPTGVSTLSTRQMALLDDLAPLLLAHPGETLKIYAFTDDTGPAARNEQLSEERAQAIAAYLRNKGIPKERMIAKGFGELYPLQRGTTAAARAKNRRIEFSLVRAIP